LGKAHNLADYSSTALSDDTCAESIREILGLEIPYSPRLREELGDVMSLDWMQGLSRRIIPLTIELTKIWSFYEDLETPVFVNTKSRDSPQVVKTEFWTPVSFKARLPTNREYFS